MIEETLDELRKIREFHRGKYEERVHSSRSAARLKIEEANSRITSYQQEMHSLETEPKAGAVKIKPSDKPDRKRTRDALKVIDRRMTQRKVELAREYSGAYSGIVGFSLAVNENGDFTTVFLGDSPEKMEHKKNMIADAQTRLMVRMAGDEQFCRLNNTKSDLEQSLEDSPQSSTEGISCLQNVLRKRFLGARINEERETINALEQNLQRPPVSYTLAYLDDQISFVTAHEVPRVAKGFVEPIRAGGYSILVGESLVLQKTHDGKYSIVFSSSRSKPLKELIVETDVRNEDLARDILNLGMYDCITQQGMKLYDAAQQLGATLFSLVRRGVEIFPADNTEGFKIKQDREQDEQEKLPRHWGQSYLTDKNPTDIVVGEMFGDGSISKGYKFGGIVVVESDRTREATYVLDAQQFETLRKLSRSFLRDNSPAGVLGRVIHFGDEEERRQEWRLSIDSLINQYRMVNE